MHRVLVVIMDTTPKIAAGIKNNFYQALSGSDITFIPWSSISTAWVKGISPDAIILTGSTARILGGDNGPTISSQILKLGIPVLGICYGYQLMVKLLGGHIQSGRSLESKAIYLSINKPFSVARSKYALNHHDYVVKAPKGWKEGLSMAYNEDNSVYMAYNEEKRHLGILYHPEKFMAASKRFFPAWLKWVTHRTYDTRQHQGV